MKRIYLILSLISLILCVTAQDKTYTLPFDKASNQIVTYVPITAIPFTTADSVSNFDNTYSVQFITNCDVALKYSIRTKITKTTGAPGGKLYLYGKTFASDTYVKFDSITYTCVGTTNTFNFTNVTNTTTGSLTATLGLTASDSLRMVAGTGTGDSLKYYGYKNYTQARKINYAGTLTSGVITLVEKPKYYRYLKVEFVASATAQKFKLSEVELKLWK